MGTGFGVDVGGGAAAGSLVAESLATGFAEAMEAGIAACVVVGIEVGLATNGAGLVAVAARVMVGVSAGGEVGATVVPGLASALTGAAVVEVISGVGVSPQATRAKEMNMAARDPSQTIESFGPV